MKILLHMPHISLKLPNSFFKGLLISKEDLRKYNLKMTDLGIDELFKDLNAVRVKAKYSRLYCDVEKFKDDSKEIMSQYGQGVVYTKTYDGTVFHKHDEKYKRKVLKYYDRYHRRLDRIARKLLKVDGFLLILDCHSYSTEYASYYYDEPFKDVCIGIEKYFYDENVLNLITKYLKSKNLTYEINYPYSGSIIPNTFLNKRYKGKVVSIMIELNKRVYL